LTDGSPHPLRRALKKIPGLKSTYYLGIVLGQMVRDPERDPRPFDDLYSAKPDPWNSTRPAEQARFATTMALLEGVAPDGVGIAVEAGCGEGIFTEMLAPRCRHLLALDYSAVGLARARERLRDAPNVEFGKWDMRRQRLPATYDLVVAMGVLTSLLRPTDVKRAARTLVEGVRPGGLLLFSDVRQSRVFETAWWGAAALRGGEQIRRYLERQRDMESLRTADTDTHVFAVYRRRANPAAAGQPS